MSWLSNLGSTVAKEVSRPSSLFKYLFPPKEALGAGDDDELTPSVKYSLVIQVGRPSSGKTTSALAIASLVESFFSDVFRVRTVVSPPLPRCLRLLPKDTEVGVLVVDDAPVMHPAYGGRRFADALNVATYFMMRHLARRSPPGIRYMLLIFNTQRFWSLDTAFREASDVDIFKSMVKEPKERKYLRRFLGRDLFQFLSELHKEVFMRRNREVLRFFVYYTTWSGRGVGEFESPLARPSNLVIDKSVREEMLERLFGLADIYEARGLTLKIIEALGRLGVNWHKTKEFLHWLRENSNVRIANDIAHKIWKRGCELRPGT